VPPGEFIISAKYTHKKLLKDRKDEWCTFKINEWADESWFKKRKK